MGDVVAEGSVDEAMLNGTRMIAKTTRASASSYRWKTGNICQSECQRFTQPSTKVIFPFR